MIYSKGVWWWKVLWRNSHNSKGVNAGESGELESFLKILCILSSSLDTYTSRYVSKYSGAVQWPFRTQSIFVTYNPNTHLMIKFLLYQGSVSKGKNFSAPWVISWRNIRLNVFLQIFLHRQPRNSSWSGQKKCELIISSTKLSLFFLYSTFQWQPNHLCRAADIMEASKSPAITFYAQLFNKSCTSFLKWLLVPVAPLHFIPPALFQAIFLFNLDYATTFGLIFLSLVSSVSNAIIHNSPKISLPKCKSDHGISLAKCQ